MASVEGTAEDIEGTAEEKADKNAEKQKQNTLSTSQCAKKANRKLASLLGEPFRVIATCCHSQFNFVWKISAASLGTFAETDRKDASI